MINLGGPVHSLAVMPRSPPTPAVEPCPGHGLAVGSVLDADGSSRPVPRAAPRTPLCVRELFEAHYDFVWRSVRRLGVTPAEADDAAQSVFIVAARKLNVIESGKERAFLFGTAMRVIADCTSGCLSSPGCPRLADRS